MDELKGFKESIFFAEINCYYHKAMCDLWCLQEYVYRHGNTINVQDATKAEKLEDDIGKWKQKLGELIFELQELLEDHVLGGYDF